MQGQEDNFDERTSPFDDEELQGYAIPTEAPQATPAPMQARPIPVTQVSPAYAIPRHNAIDLGHVDPRRAAVASLWDKASNIHNPALRVAGKVGAGLLRGLDTVGNIVAPRVMAEIPGSTLNTAIGNKNEMAREQEEAKIGQEEANTEETQARTGLAGAQTQEAEARASALGQPKTKEESWEIDPHHTGPNGEPVEIERNSGTMRVAGKEIPGIKAVAPKPPNQNDFEQFYGDWLKDNNLPDSAHNRLMARTAWAKSNQPFGAMHISLEQQRLNDQEAKANQPTNSTRTMIEAAPRVLDFIHRIRPLIKEQEGSLGPAAGRWSEFWTGKVGTPNPEFTKLRTDVGLMTTLLMRMHVGARGGEYIMKHFQDLIDSGKQSPENLNAALDEIEQYATDVKNESPQGQGSKRESEQWSAPKGAPTAPPQDGAILKNKKGETVAVSKGGQWVQP